MAHRTGKFGLPLLLSSALLLNGCAYLNWPGSGSNDKPSNTPTATAAVAPEVRAQQVAASIKPDAPTRYVVRRGDTLWDISKRFLRDPFYWPEIWNINRQIENPHLIYPGDVLLLEWVNGKPRIRREDDLGPVSYTHLTLPTIYSV